MISVEGLTKNYGRKVAVDNVSFNVEEGEILGFLGPNGAGKTTTMRILAGFMPATAGKATVNGFDVFTQSLEARRSVGYLPENVPLYPEMTTRSYLEYMAALKGVPSKDRKNRVADVAERCRVEDVLDDRLGRLSKGYRQRVGLAQALVHDPKVLILDEPTVGLDPKQITQTRDMIKSLGGSRTVILSTHILPEVSMTCDRVIIVSDGKIVLHDRIENLTESVGAGDEILIDIQGQEEAVIKLLRAVPQVGRVEPVSNDGVTRLRVRSKSAGDIRPLIARAIVGGGFGLLEMRKVTPSLEEIFLSVISRERSADDPSDPTSASKGAKKGGAKDE